MRKILTSLRFIILIYEMWKIRLPGISVSIKLFNKWKKLSVVLTIIIKLCHSSDFFNISLTSYCELSLTACLKPVGP